MKKLAILLLIFSAKLLECSFAAHATNGVDRGPENCVRFSHAQESVEQINGIIRKYNEIQKTGTREQKLSIKKQRFIALYLYNKFQQHYTRDAQHAFTNSINFYQEINADNEIRTIYNTLNELTSPNILTALNCSRNRDDCQRYMGFYFQALDSYLNCKSNHDQNSDTPIRCLAMCIINSDTPEMLQKVFATENNLFKIIPLNSVEKLTILFDMINKQTNIQPARKKFMLKFVQNNLISCYKSENPQEMNAKKRLLAKIREEMGKLELSSILMAL